LSGISLLFRNHVNSRSSAPTHKIHENFE
jgi:hypothetical protein